MNHLLARTSCRCATASLHRLALAAAVTWLASSSRTALADEVSDSVSTARVPSMAVGAQVDLLPTILSATVSELGGAGQVWFGRDHVRLRFIGARIVIPEAIHGQDGFSSLNTDVLATVVDYTFGEHFDEWWVSTGLELWLHGVSVDAIPEMQRDWRSIVWTIGGGYIWRFVGNFYLDPWIGFHVPLTNQSVEVGDATFDSLPVQPEVSMKFGYFLDL